MSDPAPFAQPTRRQWRADFLPLAILTIACLGLFHPLVLQPGEVLYADHSDFLAMHLPNKKFLVRSFQEHGELPLWNPHAFAGMPFLHDPQVAAFYPPHLALLWLREEWVGPALCWLTFAHVLAAGFAAYAYARHRALSPWSAVVAGGGTMLAGKWLLHVLAGGHYVLLPLCWLPLVLLHVEKSASRAALRHAGLAGFWYAWIILGTHPQWTFYASLFIAAWSLASCWGWDARLLGRWFATLGIMACLGIALAATQLLPTLEAAGASSRGAAGIGSVARETVGAGVLVLLGLVGPPTSYLPQQFAATWELQGGIAALWLAAACLAPCLEGGSVRRQALVALGILVFGVGGEALIHDLPGFNLFRIPMRALVLLGFPVAYLAAVTTEALFGPRPTSSRAGLPWLFLGVVVAGLLLVGAGVLVARQAERTLVVAHYWFVLPLATFLALAALRRRPRWRAAWLVALGLDALVLAAPLVQVRPEAEIYPRSQLIDFLAGAAPGRVLAYDVGGDNVQFFNDDPLGAAWPMLAGIDAVRGYNPLDVRLVKEYFTLMTGTPRYPLEGVPNLVIKNPRLLNALNVRYLVIPRDEGLVWVMDANNRRRRLRKSTDLGDPGQWRLVSTDPSPRAYVMTAGGMRAFPPYEIWENLACWPRAFLVADAVIAGRQSGLAGELQLLDLRQTVVLGQESSIPQRASPPTAVTADEDASVRIRRTPNRLEISATPRESRWLVLSEIWFPGWTARSSTGENLELYRANHALRALRLPPGEQTIVLEFDPRSLRVGRAASLAAVGVLLGILLLPWGSHRMQAS